MKKIWKYPLSIEPEQVLKVPAWNKFLSVVSQGDTPVAYFLVDPNSKTEERVKVLCYATGEEGREPPYGATYLETIPMAGGRLVFHFYRARWF